MADLPAFTSPDNADASPPCAAVADATDGATRCSAPAAPTEAGGGDTAPDGAGENRIDAIGAEDPPVATPQAGAPGDGSLAADAEPPAAPADAPVPADAPLSDVAAPTRPAQDEAAPVAAESAAADDVSPIDPPAAPDAAAPAATAAPRDPSPAATAALLAERFPALFGAGRALPLKLRIQADIQLRAPGVVGRKALSAFLHRYTTTTAYLKALVQSPHRYDLDGQPAGELADEHREAAATEVERRRAIVIARQAAERGAGQRRGPAAEDGRRRPPRAPERQPAPPGAQAHEGERPAPSAEAGVAPDAPPQADRPPQRRDDRRPPRADQRPSADHRSQPGARPPRPDTARRPSPPPGGGDRFRPPRRGDDAARPPRPGRDPAAGPRDAPAAEALAEVSGAVQQPLLSPAELEARRERASLLRAWEGSTLTTANFCTLKRITQTALEEQLAIARQERGTRPADTRPPQHPPARRLPSR